MAHVKTITDRHFCGHLCEYLVFALLLFLFIGVSTVPTATADMTTETLIGKSNFYKLFNSV